jgi:hypothetical protein
MIYFMLLESIAYASGRPKLEVTERDDGEALSSV